MKTKKEGLVNRTLDYLNLKLVNIENNIDQYQMSPRDKIKSEVLRRIYLEPALYMGLSVSDLSELISTCLNLDRMETIKIFEELASENKISIKFENPKSVNGKRLVFPPRKGD